MRIFLILFISTFICNSSIYCQDDAYLNFFNKKYLLKKGTWITQDRTNSIMTEKKGITYTFCGKKFLQKKITHYALDTNDYSISEIHYKFVDSIEFYNVIDSIKIKELGKNYDFLIHKKKKDIMISGFTIIGDSLDYEITYRNFNLNNDKDNDYARICLLKILSENSKCSKFILKDICFFDTKFDTKNGAMYYLDLDILLKQ